MAVALAHSRECTKELTSALPRFGSSMETFGASGAEKRIALEKEIGGRRASIWQYHLFFVGSATQVLHGHSSCVASFSRRTAVVRSSSSRVIFSYRRITDRVISSCGMRRPTSLPDPP